MAELDVLVIGGGGREYELARQMTCSPGVRQVYVAPGNGGTSVLPKSENIAIGPTAVDELVRFVRDNNIGLTIIGPDAAVAAGVGNALRKAGALVFGPTREAGMLESSKVFATDFMSRHRIPQPASQIAHSLDTAIAAIADKSSDEYVLKADGLAAGKGVVLPRSKKEAVAALQEMFSGKGFDGAGKGGVVIQERLHGPELSAFAITDGVDVVLLPLSQDHKRLHDNDQGPNTGGMGAYAPVPASIVSNEQLDNIRSIVERTIAAIAADGTPYQGVLYVGLMLAEERGGDPVVIEYNARFGDPETEILLPLLAASGVDILQMLVCAAMGTLSQLHMPASFGKQVLTVALASAGYPVAAETGQQIEGLDRAYPGVTIQHAGTKKAGERWLTAGGRVLYVTGLGDTIDEAAANAYGAIGPSGVHFAGMQYRRDIGHQARK